MITSDFIIENGILKKYTGTKGDIIIPDGVTSIGDGAFLNCSSILSVRIPDSVTKIGANAFQDCKKLKSITIPDSVTIIGIKAFCGCTGLESVSISARVKAIGMRAFEAPALVSIELRDGATITKDMFGVVLPNGLIPIVSELAPVMDDKTFRQYVLSLQVWLQLDFNTRCEFLTKRSGKSLMSAYNSLISAAEADEYGNYFITLLKGDPSTAECVSAGVFLVGFSKKLSGEIIEKLKDAINKAENGKKAAAATEKGLMKIKSEPPAIDPSYSETAKKLLSHYMEGKMNEAALISQWNKKLKEFCSLTLSDLPELKYNDGNTVEPFVFAWILFENGGEIKDDDIQHEKGSPWYSAESAEIIGVFDPVSFNKALFILADQYLGISGLNKKMNLAYPICRFADEAMMAELTRRAPKWKSYTSGINAPSLYTFRMANKYNNTRSAMMFAEKYGDLDAYARLRATDADTIRDKYLSDIGLDENGCKSYDLGNTIVTVRLLADFSFMVELPNGRTAKSLPKKGSDPAKYEPANKDFAEMKRSVKKIIKSRIDQLFKDFLSGRKITADRWKESYLLNPLLRKVASTVVWAQENNTFIVGIQGAINESESEYIFTDKPIQVAHPMNMEIGTVTAWQKYFTSRGLRQPFAQIWEPVRHPEEITGNRYTGCMIPFYRFNRQEKHGIYVDDYDFHNEIEITFKNCSAIVERIDWRSHEISMNDRFEITEFGFEKYTRQVNHIVAYLDWVTVWDRIRKDDVSIADLLDGFTMAQISEFANVAIESNAVNVSALIIDYKHKHFGDFNPLTEFMLDW